MTAPSEQPPGPVGLPEAGTEIETLLGALDRNRATFEWKCGGLDAAGMRATVGASTLTLAGLVKHMALVEDYYFTSQLLGQDLPEPWARVDFDADPEWEMRTALDESPEELLNVWNSAVTRSRSAVAEALSHSDLDQRARKSDWAEPPNLRRLLVDMIEEYARHTGHADLIRESVDGLVGEDPPD